MYRMSNLLVKNKKENIFSSSYPFFPNLQPEPETDSIPICYHHWAHQLRLPNRTLTLLSPWLLHKQDQSSMQSSEAFSSTRALSLSMFLTRTTTWILTTMMSYTAGEISDRRMVVRHKDLKEIVEAIKEYFDKEAATEDQVSEMLKVGWAQLDRSFRQLKIFHFPLEKTCLVTEKM